MTAQLHQRLKMVLFGNVRCKHRAVTPTEVRQLTEAPSLAGRKRDGHRKKKAELHVYLHQSILSQLVSPEMVQDDDAIIRKDQRITTRQFVLSLSASKGNVFHIVRDL